MVRYRKVTNFAALPFRERQEWVNEFVRFAEWRMSAKRKGKYHHLIIRYVWAQLNKGKAYVTADEVVRKIRAVNTRLKTRKAMGKESTLRGHNRRRIA